jgi:PKD repeat protein
MSRILPSLMIVVAMAAMLAACTRDKSKSSEAQATATPAAKVVPPSPQAQASGAADEVDELYVDLDADPDEGGPPLTVKFTSTVEDATPPITYKWDFGDGSAPGTEENPTHVYQKPGEYTATLSVKDSKGVSGSEDVDILVETE